MGRPRKPTHLKIIAGTAQPCRLNPDEPVPSSHPPAPPAWLSHRATEIFHETTADMDRMGTLGLEWCSVIADYASCREEVEICTGIVEDLGRVYTTQGQNGVMHRARPEVAMRSDAMRRAQVLRSELGLGPASKSKVSAARTVERNPFKDL